MKFTPVESVVWRRNDGTDLHQPAITNGVSVFRLWLRWGGSPHGRNEVWSKSKEGEPSVYWFRWFAQRRAKRAAKRFNREENSKLTEIG